MVTSGGGEDRRPGARAYGFEVVRRTGAPPDVLWPLVGIASRWKEWAWMTRTFLKRPGGAEPEGVGALRRFAVGPFGSVEEVVAWEPPSHLAYVARRGMPVRSYRAEVFLEPDANGTTVRWRGSVVPLIPGTGPATCALLRKVIDGFSRRLCDYAERQDPLR